jgi:hypothetical protein
VESREWMIVLDVDDAGGCGFRGFFNETPVLGLFTVGSVPNKVLRIWITSSPDNMTSTGS